MIHLHVHDSKGSLLDSIIKPEELPVKAKELGMSHVAVTNHGYMSSTIDFYKACQKENIKPIIGCELYICDHMKKQDTNDRYDHLIVLAKDNQGYRNLNKIVSMGFTDGFYYKPRIDMDTLEKHKEGLIILTACLAGEIPKMIMNGVNHDELIRKVNEYASRFLHFYLEVQGADNTEQDKVNKTLALLSKDTGVPLVATCDVHFLNQSDYELHDNYLKITNENRDNQFYKDCWFKTEAEVMLVLKKQIGFENALEAVANTHNIAKICNVEIELDRSFLPKYPIPVPYKSEDEYLRYLINRGFVERKINKLPSAVQEVYISRLKEEYEIITAKGFSGYFLIVRDIIVNICKANNILTGDGRGSADNSLVCFVLGITNVDSIIYDLNFSRFLTMERTSLPDIDMDIQSSQKQRVVNLLKEKYGRSLVAQICTYQTLQAKATLDVVGKILDYKVHEIAEIKKYIPDGVALKEAISKNSALREYQNKYPKLFEICLRFEGLPRTISVHAGGVVVCPSDRVMEEFTALALSSDKEVITQFEMHDIETVGLVKLDVLATSTLDVIADTLNLIGKNYDYLDVSKLDFENKPTYDLIKSGKTDGVFQLESMGMKETCNRVQPENMEDIIAILALYRPDTMGELEHFIKRKCGEEPITYLHSDLEPIMKATYGCMIYQEQVMQIVKSFGGYSDGEADKFRKGIGKKDPNLVKAEAENFRERSLTKNYPANVVKALADDLRQKGGYMFNKGHSTGYGITSYKTAYLKANYPIEFMCSLISNQKKPTGAIDYENVGKYVMLCKDMGINVKNPDINLGEARFTVVDGEILYGLLLIRGVGENAVEVIKNLRPFNSFEDFLECTSNETQVINKTVIVSLIKSGAFDFAGRTRADLLRQYGLLRFAPNKAINKNHIKKLIDAGVINTNDALNKELCLEKYNEFKYLSYMSEWKDKEMSGDERSWEFETISYYLSGENPFKGLNIPSWDSFEDGFNNTLVGGTVIGIKKNKTKKGAWAGKFMAFVNLDTLEGVREVIVFAEAWERLQSKFEVGTLLVCKGRKQGNKLMAGGAMFLSDWKKKFN